jgi:hypothetical protein
MKLACSFSLEKERSLADAQDEFTSGFHGGGIQLLIIRWQVRGSFFIRPLTTWPRSM